MVLFMSVTMKCLWSKPADSSLYFFFTRVDTIFTNEYYIYIKTIATPCSSDVASIFPEAFIDLYTHRNLTVIS